MKKRLLIGAVVLLVLLATAALWLNRAAAPARDYIAEFEALRAGRFPNAAAGVPAWNALVALDRERSIGAIVAEALDRAMDAARAEEIEAEHWFESGFIQWWVLDDHASILDRIDEEDRSNAERVLRAAQREALPLALEALEHPDVRSAIAAVLRHETIAPAPPHGPTLLESARPHLSSAAANNWPNAMTIRHSSDPELRLAAFELLLLNARMGASEPTFSGGIHMIMSERLAFHTALDTMAHRHPSSGAASPYPHAWLRAIERHRRLRPDKSWFFQGERLMVLDFFDAEYNQRPGAGATGIPLLTTPVIGVPHATVYRLINEYFDIADEAAVTRFHERGNAVDQPAAFLRGVGFRIRPLLDSLLPSIVPILESLDSADALLVGTLTALALLAYQADHDGQPPESLEALVPAYLDALPIDPFAPGPDQPLRYRLDPERGPVLYSLGPNQRDDHGTTQSIEREARATGDLVFLPRPGHSRP